MSFGEISLIFTCIKTETPIKKTRSAVNLCHVDGQIDQTVRVTPLVVIPRNQLHEGVIEGNASSDIKIEDALQVRKSVETTSSSVQSRTPFIGPAAASFTAATISSYFAGLFSLQVKSTTDTSGVGTRKAMPVNFPFTAGNTLPTAFAAPVELGMMFCDAQRPPRQSLPPRDGPSTVN